MDNRTKVTPRLIKQVVQLRLAGDEFVAIGKALGISSGVAGKIYNRWLADNPIDDVAGGSQETAGSFLK